MDKIYEIIKSPEWWVTVVIAGICINLLSGYLRSVLDTRLSKISRWWNSRSQKEREVKEAYINRLKTDDKFLTLLSMRHTKSRSWAIMWSILGVFCVLLAVLAKDKEVVKIILMAMGSLAYFRGYLHLLHAIRYLNFAEEAIIENDT